MGIEIKINTTELSKTIEPEQHKDPTPENPSKNKKDEDNVEDEMNDTLEINLLPEKSKWEMSDEEDHNEKPSSCPQSNPPIKTKDEPIDVDKDINSPPPKVQMSCLIQGIPDFCLVRHLNLLYIYTGLC